MRISEITAKLRSFFDGEDTAEQYWALLIGHHDFELEVVKKSYVEGVKRFSRFKCRNKAGTGDDREITGKLYIDCTHMMHSVLKEIGERVTEAGRWTKPLTFF